MLAVFFYSLRIPTIDWLILAGAAVAYALLQRRFGRWALLAFGPAWLGLIANGDAIALLEYNSVATILRHLAPGATFRVAFMIIAVLLAQRGGTSLRKLLWWGLGGATVGAFVLPIVAILTLGNIPMHQPCNLPSLESTLPSRTIEEIGTEGFFESTCPVPVATELEFVRPYGTIRMKWWGSPHRLYMVGRATDGSALRFGGPRVEVYTPNTPGTFLDAFTHRIRFQVNDFVGTPSPETLAVDVFGTASDPLEQLDLRYVPQSCTCAIYDSL